MVWDIQEMFSSVPNFYVQFTSKQVSTIVQSQGFPIYWEYVSRKLKILCLCGIFPKTKFQLE